MNPPSKASIEAAKIIRNRKRGYLLTEEIALIVQQAVEKDTQELREANQSLKFTIEKLKEAKGEYLDGYKHGFRDGENSTLEQVGNAIKHQVEHFKKLCKEGLNPKKETK